MLWKSPGGSQPILGATAAKMGLAYWDREPFRLDAAFVRPKYEVVGNLPLPLVVAIEHENDVRGFMAEIAKLTHVRCPLKVGITYAVITTPGSPVDPSAAQANIEEWVAKVAALHEIKEDPTTEYLYLLGVEHAPYSLQWHAYTYQVGDGPKPGSWFRL
jgi:hypothetical protein